MPGTLVQPQLLVEGTADRHALMHLLYRHGINLDAEDAPMAYPVVKDTEGVENLLAHMAEAVEASTRRAVGFVLDADSPLAARWTQVRNRLDSIGVDTPDHPAPEGFVGEAAEVRARVGVWLMPDNQNEGKLEDFLRAPIAEEDGLVSHAQAATDQAAQIRQRFPDADRIKAVVHTWLAWQERPGEPFGRAIQAKYFQHDSDAARAFVAWFKALYGIP